MSHTTVVWPEPPRWSRAELVRRLRLELRDRVESAYLFGSHATGTAQGDSDVDLILVTPTNLPWPERASPFADLRPRFGAMDLLVYTPDEWRNLRTAPTSFLRHAAHQWIQLLPATRPRLRRS